MKILRVFPRRTSATPDDDMVAIGNPTLWDYPADEVHISVVFTWDREEGLRLQRAYKRRYKTVCIGGPAFDSAGREFIPGKYVKNGITITSRGCPRSCGFCFVPKREGKIRLLEIKDGHDIFDNNILACPRSHIETVMGMLSRQKVPVRFSSGIDARLVRPWWVKLLSGLRLDILYTAYDHPSQYRSIEKAIPMMRDAGLGQRQIGCYVLVGYDGDTPQEAKDRLESVWKLGGMPFAMYYRGPDDKGKRSPKEWSTLVRSWSRPAAMFAMHKEPPRLPNDLEPSVCHGPYLRSAFD